LEKGCPLLDNGEKKNIMKKKDQKNRRTMRMKRIDLHTHSLFSDGSMTPEELVLAAKEAGLSAIALTDHDTVAGLDRAIAAGQELGVEVVPGVELSTEGISQVHILGYFIDRTHPALTESFALQQQERRRTHEAYMKKLNDYGFAITEEEVRRVAPVGSIGRAHYAKVMMEKGYVKSVPEAFAKYLFVGAPCYVKRNVMTPEQGISLIKKAGGVAFFAHPYQTKLSDGEIFDLMKQLKEAGLDGVEGYYSEYTPEMGEKFRKMATDLDLLLSGGSDFHAAMKPHIAIGSGINGTLSVDGALLERIRERAAEQKN
jgi:predicted metal-dependent phosphoesterase TrpH